MKMPEVTRGASNHRTFRLGLLAALAAAALLLPMALWAANATLTINVVPSSGPAVGGFYWTVEEDNTYPVTPGVFDPLSMSVNIYRSHAPVVAAGTATGTSTTVVLDNAKRYIVSAVPFAGTPATATEAFTQSGAPVKPGQTSVTITVNPTPVPTAQIFVLVFEDNSSINGAPDQPAEAGIGGFHIEVFDQLGLVSQDALGNPIGTQYDPLGNPTVMGQGFVTSMTAADVNNPAKNPYNLQVGEALVKYLYPGKYGVRAVPPADQVTSWVQTATIEGTPGIDAWVRAGEPPYMAEFGMTSWHAFIGFVHPMAPPGGSGTITGQVMALHETPPPIQNSLFPGEPVGGAWVGLNDLNAADQQVCAIPCDANGNFTIQGVPPGTYLLSMWDRPLDQIIDFRTVVIPPEGGTVALGQLGVFSWFGRYQGSVFNDPNQNGFRDPGETGIGNMVVNIRHPDASIYQTTVTDSAGNYELNEVFPFFHWMITEVDYSRLKATGATIRVDKGGLPDVPGTQFTAQPQPEQGGAPYRIEIAPPPGTLLEAMTLYAGNTNIVDYGKAPYAAAENGGITGIIWNTTTRAEDDPRFAVAELWETAIPRAQVNLYRDSNLDGVIDDINSSGLVELADVDNYPLGWSDGTGPKGPEDVDRNANGIFDQGDALAITHTDSWDDLPPSGCVNSDGTLQTTNPQYVQDLRYPASPVYPIVDCAETYRTFNQLRPGVFDGGYSFQSIPGYPNIPRGAYIVETPPPPGYDTVKEEDKNVLNGEPPNPNMLPAPCVGDLHVVPHYLQLFPGDQLLSYPYQSATDPLVSRPLCDRKEVIVRDGQNAAADFHLFTKAPKAGRIWGVILDDTVLEFNPASPNFGNNLGVAWIPIAIKDYLGREIGRTYSDQWGRYNALVPTTYTINPPIPTGVSPQMHQVCLNDPGPIPDPAHPGQFITDPWYNPGYTQTCLNFDFWPGKTTNCDTPILPIAGFQANRVPLDCEFADGVPLVKQVDGSGTGPYLVSAPGTLTITAVGPMLVHNPDYDPNVPGSQPTVTRNFDFGATQGTVKVNGTTCSIVGWSNLSITATVPAGTTTGQLEVTRSNGAKSPLAVTVHIGDPDVIHVSPGPHAIQNAIDAANAGQLIILNPGIYKENPILWKKVKLQGAGTFVTQIQAGPMSADELTWWTNKLTSITGSGAVDLVPGERADFYLEQGAGVMVLAKDSGVFRFTANDPATVDGLEIIYATQGGGIFVNGYAHYLQLSNNRLVSNQGSFGGGIRVGTPSIVCVPDPGPPAHNCPSTYESSFNDHLFIHNNQIAQNGAIDGGGGLALFNGSDGYLLEDNLICGNYSFLYGGGVDHFGLSPGANVHHNVFLNNESFDEGGGIMIAGELTPAGAPPTALTPGAGSISVDKNLFQGNKGGDDGGAIRTLMVNGMDVQSFPSTPSAWHQVLVTNNMIVNNMSADAGGGLSLDDTARIFIIDNTIVHNDSTASNADAFGGPCVPAAPAGQVCPEPAVGGGGLTTSNPQVAGIASRPHSAALQAAFGPGLLQTYSDPVLQDNIIWQNRSWWWDAAFNGGLGGLRPITDLGAPTPYWDMAVYQASPAAYLDPQYSLLTTLNRGDGTFYNANNVAADPLCASTYFNLFQATSSGTALGNFVTVAFTPTGLHGDSHITSGSPARNIGGGIYWGTFPDLRTDFDLEARPNGGYDAGADEFGGSTAVTDLAVTMTVSPSSVLSGQPTRYTYVATVHNNGPIAAQGVVLLDPLPLPVTLVNASSTQGPTTVVSGTVNAFIGTMAPGATVTVTIAFTKNASSSFSNSATVSMTSPVESLPVNNTSTATVVVSTALLGAPQNLLLGRVDPVLNGANSPLTLAWQAPAELGDGCTTVSYDVLRTTNPGDWTNAAVCVASDIAVTTATDSTATGPIFFYLVRAENACGSDMGTDSDGELRIGRTCP
jgi:uncharacterized repeat protein (TIGR01451 family)